MKFESEFFSPVHLQAFTSDPSDVQDLAAFGMHIAVFSILPGDRPDRAPDGYSDNVIEESWKKWRAGGKIEAKCAKDTTDPVKESYNVALNQIYSNRKVANQIVIDLLVAAANKDLNPKRYQSYCLSKKGVHANFSDVQDLLKWASVKFVGAMGSVAIRESLTKNDWVTYHTSFASVGALCNRMFTIVPRKCVHIVSIEDRKAAKISMRSPWDRDLARVISDKGLAFTEIAVRVMGLEIGTFYAGKRALQNIDPMTHSRFEEIVKQIMKKDKTLKKVKKVKTVDEVYAAVPGVPNEYKEATEREVARRRVLALAAINRNEIIKVAKAKAAEAGDPFIYTADMVSKAQLDEVDEDEF